jgi:hypothetical protein
VNAESIDQRPFLTSEYFLLRCLSYQYDLRNLSEHRCPECGREFDPNALSTFESRPKEPRLGYLLVLLVIVFAVVSIGQLSTNRFDLLGVVLPLTGLHWAFSIVLIRACYYFDCL